MDGFLIRITQINKSGKTHETTFECENMISVSRIILTFKAKRNYEIVEYLVTPYKTLI